MFRMTENTYPTRTAMEDQAASLGLTYEQVRGWVIERRRRDKREDKTIISQNTCKELSAPGGRSFSGVTTRSIVKNAFSFSKCIETSIVSSKICKKKKKHNQLQELFATDYILQKVLHKDGSSVGVDFESPGAFCFLKGFLCRVLLWNYITLLEILGTLIFSSSQLKIPFY